MIYSIFEQTLIMLPLVFGGYLTLSLLKLPDFSVESAFLFGAVAAFLARELSLPIVLLSAIGGGMVVGCTVTFLNQFLHIPYLIAAIITNGLFHGLTQYALGTSVASFHLPQAINEVQLALAIAIALVTFLFFALKTEAGMSLAIFGNNPAFFANHNMSGRFVVIFGVLLGHALAGISGFLFALSNGFVDLTMNFGILLLSLSALMLGKLALKRAKPAIIVPILGVIAFFVMQQLLLHLGMNLKYYNAFQAIFVLLVLYFGNKQKKCFDLLGV